ncbi:MAG: RNA polymerase sigma factor RpoD/SigA [Chitinophagales bacterium]
MRAFVISNSITPREQRSVERYLQDVSKYDVLSPDEEAKLFMEYKSGCDLAYNKIINHNLRFVVSVSKKYQNMGLTLGDLINEGNVGLIKAAQRFDISRGFKFISYAVWWIRQSILQALSDKGRKIRLPLNVTANMSKVRQAMAVINQHEEREPTIDELAEATELSRKVVQKCLDNYQKCQSLDKPLNEESENSLTSVLVDESLRQPDYQMAIVETQKTDIDRLLSKLPEREATVLSMFYGINSAGESSLSDIAEKVGVSRERVRQIKDKAIRMLRGKAHKINYAATFSAN